MTATHLNIRAIVFDLDGVLIDSAPCHRAAFEEVFRPFGVVDFDYSRYAGWRTAEVVESVLRHRASDLTPELLADLAAAKSRIARERLAAANPVMPECVQVLEDLSSNYKLALASSGSRQTVELFLARNNITHLFQSVLCGDSVSKAKPDPEIYERSFATLKVSPTQGVVVEDAIAGIHAALAAGAAAVIGITGTSPSAELCRAGAAHVVDALCDLPSLLHSEYAPANSN